MIKRISQILLIVFVSLSLSGCATAMNEFIDPKPTQVQTETVIGTYVENDFKKNESDDNMAVPNNEKTIDGSLDASVDYETDGKIETRGTDGLKYTLNSVEVYNRFSDSGEDIHVCTNLHEWDTKNKCWFLPKQAMVFLDSNNFILVEMTATYTASEEGKEEIDVYVDSDILATYKKEKMPEDWMDEFNTLRDNDIYIMEPVMYWFSEPIREEDGYDPVHDGFCFKLSNGESKTFKIGIYCWSKFVEYKNVYLSIQHFNPGTIKGYDGRYFALFPEG